MWMHIDTGDYEWARAGVAVADRVTGPYRYLRSFRPHNQMSRDLTVFQASSGLSRLHHMAFVVDTDHACLNPHCWNSCCSASILPTDSAIPARKNPIILPTGSSM